LALTNRSGWSQEKFEMDRPNEFTNSTLQFALMRQKNRCASCGTPILALGILGRAQHEFGEAAHGHHVRHVKWGGTNALDNCVILCTSCHYNSHEGGNYRWGTVQGTPQDFPHYNG